MGALRMTLTTDSGTTDVTGLVSTAKLSGDYRQCCRTLTLEIAVTPTPGIVPYVYFPLGGCVQLYAGDALRFYGHVVSKTKATDSTTMTVTCFDRGFYLKNNYATYNFNGQTPEAITRRVCADFGIGVGPIQTTGVTVRRKFRATALYTILDTVWTLAGEQTGKRYMQRFVGPALGVFERRQTATQKTIEAGVNLMTAAYTESIEKMVNRVSIYDSNDKLVSSVSDDAAVKLYGLLRKIVQQGKDEDKGKEARRLLEDNGVERRVTVTCLGDDALITGETVQLVEPYTGQIGVFWIDTDEHSWHDGIYTNKLTLNYRNMMREGSAGSEDK